MIVSEDERSKTGRNNVPTTAIVGDSMVQKVFDVKLSKSRNNKHHVAIRSFYGARAQIM